MSSGEWFEFVREASRVLALVREDEAFPGKTGGFVMVRTGDSVTPQGGDRVDTIRRRGISRPTSYRWRARRNKSGQEGWLPHEPLRPISAGQRGRSANSLVGSPSACSKAHGAGQGRRKRLVAALALLLSLAGASPYALPVTECSASPTWSVGRDDGGFGRMESYTDPHGRSLVVGRYPDSMRVHSLDWTDSPSGDTLGELFEYDPRGRLKRAETGDVTYEFSFHEGRLARKDLSVGSGAVGSWSVGCDYLYDPSGLLAYAVGPSFAAGSRRLSLAYSPDVAARLWKLSVRTESLSIDGSCPSAVGVDLDADPDTWCVDQERSFVFTRDALGRLTSIDHPNGVVSEYSYFPDDPRARLDSLRAFTSSGLALVDLDYSYHPLDSALLTGISDLDAARRIVDSGGSIPQDRQPGWAYDYDPLDRLASASFVEVVSQGATLAPSSPALSSYTYDTVGRRTLASFAGAGALEEKAGTYTWDDLGRLSSVGAGTSFAYDASGRMTSFVTDGVTHSFEYDPRGRVQSLVRTLPNAPPEPPSTDAYAFKYGFDHRIVELTKPSGSTVRFFDDGLATYELAPDGELTSATIWQPDGFSPLASVRIVNGEAAFFYFHNNHLSAPVVVTDDNENVVWAASYSPFGVADTDGIAFDQPIRLPGQLDLFGGDVTYNWHRFYLPRFGLYATLDPDQWGLGSSFLGLERYNYAHSAPTIYIDPDGRDPFTAAAMDLLTDFAFTLARTWFASGPEHPVDAAEFLRNFDPTEALDLVQSFTTFGGATKLLPRKLAKSFTDKVPDVLKKACSKWAAWGATRFNKHHTVPREILKALPDDVANSPLIRGKAGSPNRWKIPIELHKSIHKGAGGGAYNETFKAKLKELGRDPTVDDVLSIRDELVKQFGLEGYRP